MENEKLDYVRLWKTILKMGIKETFSVVRREFFMTIANNGPHVYIGKDALDDIIENSRVFKISPELVEGVRKAIPEGDSFKHYFYSTSDGTILIEYFANLSEKAPKEFVEYVFDKEGIEQDIDGHCSSMEATDTIKKVSLDDDGEIIDSDEELITQKVTTHLITIWEGNSGIEPELYPMIIKHELTHACIFDLKMTMNTGYFSTCPVPPTWTDEDILEWNKDLEYFSTVINNNSVETDNFIEFVCEFLMYESDGQIKVKNPVVESRVPKNVRSDSKPKITYRNVTPFERFQEVMDTLDGVYKEKFEPILEALRPCYSDYDTFLESIRM